MHAYKEQELTGNVWKALKENDSICLCITAILLLFFNDFQAGS